jgi:hypothetical protein
MFFFDESKQINTFMVTGKGFYGPWICHFLPHRFGDILLTGYIGDVRIYV